MEFIKKNLLAVFVILILAVILIVGQKLTEKTQELTFVKLGKDTVPIPALAVNVAKKKGIFSKNGLNVEDTAIMGGAANALASGQVDFQVQRVASFLASDVKGSGARWISTIVRAEPFYLLSKVDPGLIKKVGVNRLGGEDYYQTVMSMKLAGISPENIEFVTTGGYEGKFPILEKGGADLIGLPLTTAYFGIGELGGVKVLFNLADDENSYYPVGLLALGKTISEKPEIVKKLKTSLSEAISYVREREHKDEIVSMIISDYSVDEKSAGEIYEGFVRGTNNLNQKPREDFVSGLLKLMEKDVPEAKDYDPKQFIWADNTDLFLKEGYGI